MKKEFILFFCTMLILATYNYIAFTPKDQIQAIGGYIGDNNPENFGEHPEIRENPDIDPYYNEDKQGDLNEDT